MRSCCERVKVGAVVTRTAGINEFVSKNGGAEDEGWSESNMAAILLFVEHLEYESFEMPEGRNVRRKLVVKNRKNNLEAASKESPHSGKR